MNVTLTNGFTSDLGNVVGRDGKDGVGIDQIYIQDGNLYVKKTTDDSALNLGSIKGEKGDKGDKGEQGAAGRGILKTEISGNNLIIYYTDGTFDTHDIGTFVGETQIKFGNFIFVLLENGTYGVKASNEFSLTNLVIPEKYNDIPITVILKNGFKNINCIKSIELPSTLERIEEYAFFGCEGLTDVIIPSTTSFIGAFAFYNSGVQNITLSNPSNWLAGSSDFTYKYYSRSYNSGSTDLNDRTSISIQKFDLSDTQKAAVALSDATTIQYMSVSLKSGGTTTTTYYDETYNWYAENWTCNVENQVLSFVLLEDGNFSVQATEFAATVSEIVIPETYKGGKVVSIEASGFENFTNLESVVLPDTIKTINARAFYGCTNLTINIPQSVKTINSYALYNVKNINVSGTNSWSITGASWSEFFGDTLIDSGRKNYSSMVLSAYMYSRNNSVTPTRGGDEAYISPYTAIWTR